MDRPGQADAAEDRVEVLSIDGAVELERGVVDATHCAAHRAAETCPVNECGRPTKGNLMCSSHWRLVAHEARGVLADAGKAYRRAKRAKQPLGGPYLAWEAAACLCIHPAETHARG